MSRKDEFLTNLIENEILRQEKEKNGEFVADGMKIVTVTYTTESFISRNDEKLIYFEIFLIFYGILVFW